MEITSITTTNHEVPVDVPLLDEEFAFPIAFTRIETDEGIEGYGISDYLWPTTTAQFIQREIEPLILGENPVETERLWDLMHMELNSRYQTGVWSTAVSAVDIALWDIKGKYYEDPVWRLLGGAQNPVPEYVTFGLSDYDEEQLVEVAENFVSDGETRLKMVVGGQAGPGDRKLDTIEDAARVRAVREAVGENVELMIDANHHFSFDQALDLCNRIEQYNVTWFEEPVYGNDPKLLADLRERTRVPIAAGQNEGHRYNHRDLIANGAVDISQPNVCYVGGYTEGKKVASLAQTFNLRIANGGGWPHHNMHLHAGMPNGWRVEFHYIMWKAGEEIYQNPPGPDGGVVTLKEDPGLGLEPDWDALEEMQIE